MRSPAPPLQMVSTDSVRAPERRDFWQSGGSSLFGPLQLEQQGRESFDANLSYTRFGDLIFCRLAARVSHSAIRTNSVAIGDHRPFLKAVLQTKGRSVIAQGGRTTPLLPGEWTVYDAGEPYSVTLTAGGEFSLILMPREKVVTRGFDLRSLVLRPLSARRGFGKLIWNLVDNTIDQIPELQQHSSDVAEIVAQMFRIALFDSFEGRGLQNSSEALRQRVKLYVSAHLGDPEFSLARLAELTHCSKRYLHMIFRAEGVSICGYILKSRLDRCRTELLNPASAHRSITDIAYSWGFNNSNHFSRCFKREFGVAPRELRNDLGVWSRLAASEAKPS
ncbi:MAG TPA: helix-turn-helix domain-containing protein [Candidatus Dormibacteraeota bacterium]|nr:helix-turn-helix domain-containing protein [Candidatus Dormibacteraeota bacterium]